MARELGVLVLGWVCLVFVDSESVPRRRRGVSLFDNNLNRKPAYNSFVSFKAPHHLVSGAWKLPLR